MSDSNLTVDEAAAESAAPASPETNVPGAGAEIRQAAQQTVFAIIAAVSVAHLINDIMQSLLTASYPMLKDNYHLDFGQIGFLTFTFQVTASLLQPLVGLYTDKKPLPFSLPIGMGASLIGLIVLAYAGSYPMLRQRLGRLLGDIDRMHRHRAQHLDRMGEARRNPERMVGRYHPAPELGRNHHDPRRRMQQLGARMAVRRHRIAIRILAGIGKDRAARVLDPGEPHIMQLVEPGGASGWHEGRRLRKNRR